VGIQKKVEVQVACVPTYPRINGNKPGFLLAQAATAEQIEGIWIPASAGMTQACSHPACCAGRPLPRRAEAWTLGSCLRSS